jgi:hypothetical protein
VEDVGERQDTSDESEDDEMVFDFFGMNLGEVEPRPTRENQEEIDSLAVDKMTQQVSPSDARAYQRDCHEKQKRNNKRMKSLGLQPSAVPNKKATTSKKRKSTKEGQALSNRRSACVAVPFVAVVQEVKEMEVGRCDE